MGGCGEVDGADDHAVPFGFCVTFGAVACGGLEERLSCALEGVGAADVSFADEPDKAVREGQGGVVAGGSGGEVEQAAFER